MRGRAVADRVVCVTLVRLARVRRLRQPVHGVVSKRVRACEVNCLSDLIHRVELVLIISNRLHAARVEVWRDALHRVILCLTL